MRIIGVLLGAVMALTFLGGAGSAGQSQDLDVVYFTTAPCPPAAMAGPGNSPDNPIVPEDFTDPWSAAANEDTQYDCRWVKLTGYFRWSDYYHYRGSLYASSSEYYLGDRARSTRPSYVIENFERADARRAELVARKVEVVGQFYDLCAKARAAEARSGQSWMVFGPCHYGGDRGMMLGNVRVLSVSKEPAQVLGGEGNRKVVGDLVEAPRDWPALKAVQAQARDWLKTVRQGRTAYVAAMKEELESLSDEQKAEELSPDGWIAYLTDPKRSKAARGGSLKVFLAESDLQNLSETYEAQACFCLEGSCRDSWPLLWWDAERIADKYVCKAIENKVNSKAEFVWTWH